MTTLEKLSTQNNNGKFICVGLDTDIEKIPLHLRKLKNPLLKFNKAIIDSTQEYAAAYKINFAFYERSGNAGLKQLEETIDYIPSDIISIADAKRGDIGNTSKMYALSVFDYYKCDAVTLHPYMGYDSVEPFLEYSDKLCFILALTSNWGSVDFEKLKLENGRFLYQEVIENVKGWNRNHNCGIVFGATNIEELIQNVESFGSLPVLLPGIGAQGGSLETVIETFKSANRKNFLINVSRSLIYKSGDEDFAEHAREELIKISNIIKTMMGPV